MLLLPLSCPFTPTYTRACTHSGRTESRKEHSLEGKEALLKGQIITRDLKVRQKKEAL